MRGHGGHAHGSTRSHLETGGAVRQHSARRLRPVLAAAGEAGGGGAADLAAEVAEAESEGGEQFVLCGHRLGFGRPGHQNHSAANLLLSDPNGHNKA